jgi:TRAP-type C4-dicarboxylate transport system substrate-binding protein
MKVKFNYGQFGPEDTPGLMFRWFADTVTERTKGRLVFEHIYSFALTKPGEEIVALQSGLCDVGNTCVVYHPVDLYINCGFPRAVPWAVNEVRLGTEIMYKLYYEVPETAKILSDEFAKHGLKFVSMTCEGGYVIESKTPITKLDDLKGMKIACIGNQSKWLTDAGAAVAGMPVGDRPTALQTGVIEAVATPFSISFPFKLYEFAPYMLQSEWGAVTGNPISWNMDKFNELPADIQNIIIETGREAFLVQIEQQEKWINGALATAKEAGQIVQPNLSDEEKAKWADLLGEPVAGWVKGAEDKGITGSDTVVAKYIELSKEAGHKFPKEWKVK